MSDTRRGRLAQATTCLLLAGGLCAASPAHAATSAATWTKASPAASPPGNFLYTRSAYDAATGQLVMYDPLDLRQNCPATNSTWVWDGQTWASPAGGAGPILRVDPALVYDDATRQVIMFGGGHPGCGTNGSQYLGDTWSWNGTHWTQLHPATSPPASAGSCAAYDPAIGQVVMIGGIGDSGQDDPNTWTWDGTTWTPHLLSPSPPTSTFACGMAYDALNRQMVFTSDNRAATSVTIDTWTYDGTTWSEHPSPGPGLVFGVDPTIAYDATIGNVVFYNGIIACSPPVFGDCLQDVSQTWAWSGSAWQQLNLSAEPTSRSDGAFAFDAGTQQLVLFGGDSGGDVFGDTWVFAQPGTSSVVPERLAGQDRDTTAVAISQAAFPTSHSASAVVLTRNDLFADALAGGPLATAKNAPLLLTSSQSFDATTATELSRVLAPGGTVYLLGGKSALSASVQSAVTTLGYAVVRLSGSDRYGTAIAIAGALGNPTTVFEASGQAFPDALSAVPAAAHVHGVILLTDGSVQSAETAAYLKAHPGVRYAVGGPAAAADPTAPALVGADRYATSAAVARAFFPEATSFSVATGVDFADALSGGPFAGAHSQPLLLVPTSGPVPEPIHAFICTHAADTNPVEIFGGTAAVSDADVASIQTIFDGS